MSLSRLIEYASVSIGQGAPQKIDDFSKEGNPFIRAGSLESLTNGGTLDSLEFISDESAKRNKLKLYPINSVVFAKSGMSATKDRVYKLTRPCYVVSHLAVLLPNEKTHPDYLRLVLQRSKPSTLIKDPAYPSISQGDIENFKLPFPPLYDQIRIATVLTGAERLIAKRKESTKALDELLKSTFLEMFGDPVRNEKGWEKKRIDEIAEVRIGPFGSLLHSEDYVENGIPLINPSHIINGEIVPDYTLTITSEKFKELEPYQLRINDVVVARRGEIGRCAIVRTTKLLFCGTGSMFIRILDDYYPLLLQHQIYKTSLKYYLESKAKGVTMKNLNSTTLGDLQILYPPLPLQNQFAAIVEKVESIKAKQTQSLAELENLYDSLSQRAFKGELDLSGVGVERSLT